MSFQPYILVIGANPAWEKVLEFQEFQAGEVNRALRVGGYAAGKATNFCRALQHHGGLPGRQLTFLGGETGHRFSTALATEGLECQFVPVDQETRTCTNCVCQGTMTELVEPGTPITKVMLQEFLSLLRENLADTAGVAVAGSIPAGSCDDFMREVALATRNAQLPLLLDNYQDASEALSVKPDLILKINAMELRRLTGQETIAEGLAWLGQRYAKVTAAITDGPSRAWLLDGTDASITTLEIPKLDKIVNPLGAGDTASAVFFERLLAHQPCPEAFADALAAASASCLTDQAGCFVSETAAPIREAIRLSRQISE